MIDKSKFDSWGKIIGDVMQWEVELTLKTKWDTVKLVLGVHAPCYGFN